jgi:hypothetical protein
LVLGVAVIDRGTEDPDAETWVREGEIAHYDINPKNGELGSTGIATLSDIKLSFDGKPRF